MGRFEYLEFDRDRPFVADEEALEETPELLLASGWDRYWEGAFEAALRAFSRVLRHQYLNTTAWAGQVWCLIELKELNEADLWADRGMKELEDTPGVLSGKAIALGRQGFSREAMLWTDKAVSCSHKREDRFALMAWIARAELLLKAGNKRNVELCVAQATSIPGVGFRAQLAAGRACLHHRRHLSAIRYLDEAVRRQPSNHHIWWNLCLAHKGLGHLRQAEQSLERVLEIEPSLREATLLQKKLAMSGGGFTGFFRRLFG